MLYKQALSEEDRETNFKLWRTSKISVNVFRTNKEDLMSIIVPEIISAISRDEELTSIGFPNGLGVGTSFEPFSFRSYPASNIVRNVSGLDGGYVSDAFFLENASCGGYSGCPIIDLGYRVTGMMTQTSNTYIYGIMHGTVSDNTGGKMAVVTPGYYILEII